MIAPIANVDILGMKETFQSAFLYDLSKKGTTVLNESMKARGRQCGRTRKCHSGLMSPL